MNRVQAEIAGIMLPTDFPSVDHALPVLWEHVRELPIREAHRDYIRFCIGPGGGEGVTRCLARGNSWSTTLYVGEMTDPTAPAYPIVISPHP
ncbi:hypothetical protein [Kitasatospora sp. NPDC086791]|uniref:hypothetical protein n=1 Tax=Kitasatospora sp. NPDC086791 TaxID=3155178 RepID=UPI00342EA064